MRSRLLPALLLAGALLAPAAARAETEVDLVGTWHVLIHYKNVYSNNPDAERWDDRVWKFSKKGSRLEWIEWPIVVFSNKYGRFEPGASGPARMLNYWEPNELQVRDIKNGPQVNKRGAKTKSLKGSPKKGYATFRSQRSFTPTTVGYAQTWRVEAPTTLPVFTQDDALGTEAALESGEKDGVASGRTRYTTTEVSAGGNVLSGTFVRDENRSGTFRMTRAGEPRDLESDGRTPNEKERDRYLNR